MFTFNFRRRTRDEQSGDKPTNNAQRGNKHSAKWNIKAFGQPVCSDSSVLPYALCMNDSII